MPCNLLAKVFFNSDRTLAQRIKGAVQEVEKRRENVSLAHAMDKLIYDAFVVFANKSNQLNNIKFLYDVTRFKYLCTQAEDCCRPALHKRSNLVTSDGRFQMLFSITADYVMLQGMRAINFPTYMQKELIAIVCEYLQMGTVSHLVGIPSLARFFEMRYNQLQTSMPTKQMKIPKDIVDRLGYDQPLRPFKQIDKSIFNNMFDYIIEHVLVIYEEFGKDMVC